jgi:pyridoxamine 5'-phosphate oxidase
MSLSTVSEKGFPSSRMVLLKYWDTDGLVFFTNYESRKGHHLEANPNVAALFFWKGFERQVRIEGLVERVAAGLSDDYFVDPYQFRFQALQIDRF